MKAGRIQGYIMVAVFTIFCIVFSPAWIRYPYQNHIQFQCQFFWLHTRILQETSACFLLLSFDQWHHTNNSHCLPSFILSLPSLISTVLDSQNLELTPSSAILDVNLYTDSLRRFKQLLNKISFPLPQGYFNATLSQQML